MSDRPDERFLRIADEVIATAGYGQATHVPVGVVRLLIARSASNMATHPRVQRWAETQGQTEIGAVVQTARPSRDHVGMMMLGLINAGETGMVGYGEADQRKRAAVFAQAAVILAEALMTATPWEQA